MSKNMNISGFGLIELVVTMAIVIILTVSITKIMRSNVETAAIESKGKIMGAFITTLSDGGYTKITEAGNDYLLFSSGALKGGFRLLGDYPYGKLELFDGEKNHVIEENISRIIFSYYDSNSNLIFDEDASAKPAAIARIKVTAYKHKGAEDPNWIIADSVKGIDLDGDLSNGTARLSEIEFIVDLNR